MYIQHMNIFRATHVVELRAADQILTIALRLVSDPHAGVQVFRDVFANEYVVDDLSGCPAWPTGTQVHALQGGPVPLSWLRSAKPRECCTALPLFACA